MSARSLAGWGAGASVVLTSVSAALINELHGGWQWWAAASSVVLITAGFSAWLALRGGGGGGDRLGAGAVKADRDIRGSVETHIAAGSVSAPGLHPEGEWLGPGAVEAERDIWGGVKTNTESARMPPQQ